MQSVVFGPTRCYSKSDSCSLPFVSSSQSKLKRETYLVSHAASHPDIDAGHSTTAIVKTKQPRLHGRPLPLGAISLACLGVRSDDSRSTEVLVNVVTICLAHPQLPMTTLEHVTE